MTDLTRVPIARNEAERLANLAEEAGLATSASEIRKTFTASVPSHVETVYDPETGEARLHVGAAQIAAWWEDGGRLVVTIDTGEEAPCAVAVDGLVVHGRSEASPPVPRNEAG